MQKELRGPLTPDFLRDALKEHPQRVVVTADDTHRLEYSFGVDVLKFKPQIRDFVRELSDAGIECGVETDFRHENILHAGDCGAAFVEIDVSNYLPMRQHYIQGIEIANERGIGVVITGENAREFAADMPATLIFETK